MVCNSISLFETACTLSFLTCHVSFSALWWTTSCSLLALLHLWLLELHWVLQIHRSLQLHQWDGPGLLRPSAHRRHSRIWDQCRTWTLREVLDPEERKSKKSMTWKNFYHEGLLKGNKEIIINMKQKGDVKRNTDFFSSLVTYVQ